jgi:hypothetical protein
MSSLVRMLEFIAAHFGRDLFDFTATGRTFVQAAFGTERRSRLAAFLSEGRFAALAAKHHIPPAVDGRAAAQDRAFVQPTVRAGGESLFAAVFTVFHFTAQPAQRDFGVGIVRVGDTKWLLAAARKGEQTCCQTRQHQA